MSGPSEPAAPPAGEDVARFLLELGRLLLIAGDAVTDIERRLGLIAAAWGQHEAQFLVLPGSVVVTLGPRASAQLATVVDLEASSLRLDQITAVFRVARDAERGELDPVTGLGRLEDVRSMVSRYPVLATVVGQVVLVVGIALAGTPSGAPLWLYALLALVVALIMLVAERVRGLDSIVPVFAAAAVSLTAFAVAGPEYDATSVQALIPPLVTLLPGALLTMAVIDLASGESVTGASRFLAGLLQLALLAAGIAAGAALAGVSPPTESLASGDAAWWVPWVGILVFALGMALQRSVPLTMLPWLLVVLYGAFAGQILGERLFDRSLGGFVGGLVAAPLAIFVERFRSAPPAFVAFLPAFWLLVPGALGLLGVSQIVIEDPVFGIASFIEAITAIVLIALGVLVGVRVTSVLGGLKSTGAARLRQ